MNAHRLPYYQRQRPVPRNKDPLTSSEAAWLITCCPATIIKQIKSGELPARKVRGRFLINNHDFWRWFYKPKREALARLIMADTEKGLEIRP